MAVLRQLDFEMVTPERAAAVLARLEPIRRPGGFIPWRPQRIAVKSGR